MSDVRTFAAQWNLTYNHSAGEVGTRFFNNVQKHGQITGTVCPSCDRVLVPPRAFCDRCHLSTDGWREVGPAGVIETYTVVYQRFPQLPEPPYAIAYVTLEGADTAILNFVRGLDLEDPAEVSHCLRPGTPVVASFLPDHEREGSVLDFWFEPVT